MLNEADACLIAEKYYGVDAQASRLPGEYDSNFHLTSKHGQAYLLKISHPNEIESIISLQNAILQYIAMQNPPFAVPRLQPSLQGELVYANEERQCYMRLFTFLPGQLFANVSQTPPLWLSLGVQLGHLSASLKQFHHSAAERYLKWDLQQAHWIANHLSQLPQVEEVEFFLQRFVNGIAGKLSLLPQSIIHGDLNDYNILVTNEAYVSGFIDFGDVVKTATICELAIALAYVMMNQPDPLAVANTVIKAYHSIFPLHTTELEILFDLICMRLCVSVVNSALRKKENPDDTYLVISEQPAWALLKKLRAISPDYALNCFRITCGYDNAN